MKKKLCLALSALFLIFFTSIVEAKSTNSSDLANAIKLYKAGNYSECYVNLNEYIKKDSTNALAYYYLAISSAQVGRKDEALSNYEKAIVLSPKFSNLYNYATKGKICAENPDKCESGFYESPIDEFIRGKNVGKLSEEVKGDFERLKIENLMRDINRENDIDPQRFREYKDFSSMNNAVPSNEDVLAAFKVLQNAGLMNSVGNLDGFSSLYNVKEANSLYNLMDSSTMNPHIIQAMLANKMTLGL